MGLNISHGDFSMSYSSFHEFRTELAKLVGLDYDKMQGLGGDIAWETDTKLVFLLNHSDCDESISTGQLKILIPELKELKGKLSSKFFSHQLDLFIDGCELALKAKRPLEFM